MRKFEEWIQQLNDTIEDYKFFVNFEKIHENVKSIEKELTSLNSLIGTNNIEKKFAELIEQEPSIIKCIPKLLALRKDRVSVLEKGEEKIFYFNESKRNSIEEYTELMRKTGLFDLLESGEISDLKQYMIGLEIGLDTNARKNRIGYLLENLVEEELKKIPKIQYKKDAIIENEKESRRADFLIINDEKKYVIETSYQSMIGSKLRELIRRYYEETKMYKEKGITYILVLDGRGWKFAGTELKELFERLQYVYNLKDVQKGELGRILK